MIVFARAGARFLRLILHGGEDECAAVADRLARYRCAVHLIRKGYRPCYGGSFGYEMAVLLIACFARGA